MSRVNDAIDYVEEMSQATGVGLILGANVYLENSDSWSSYSVLVDPSSLSDEDEVRLIGYSVWRGFRMI